MLFLLEITILYIREHKQSIDRANFRRFVRFGVVDSSLLMISLLAGFSLDSIIAKRIGARVLIYRIHPIWN